MRTLGIVCLATVMVHAPAVGADPLRDAAMDAEQCRSLGDRDVRLACFDAAAARIAEALGAPGSSERVSEAPAPAETPSQAVEAAGTAGAAVAAAPRADAEAELPTWAAEPVKRAAPPVDDPRQFEASVVRITRLPNGRHRFYTVDGAVWEQTQDVRFRPPEALPAMAEFNRRMTGNPTIRFDVSNRSYRVKRID